ncbi:hypothetical protein ERX37_09535 [Macrococcus hajekii]|uniref:LPXTG cell wall anchor domain-containing protein n=1 Tax=Macrococcus hajekii TaxID=198482 RepID=A0A4V3BDT1_9STAP|nr:hypothetical protein [Macrococcus hajekii]TDM01344.1 hypothetical protein ERX37_09535 [Macrococcus hajekii]GGB10837.1 hypothetical protein GCM10007190_18630 [Macrococcus hajekii]
MKYFSLLLVTLCLYCSVSDADASQSDNQIDEVQSTSSLQQCTEEPPVSEVPSNEQQPDESALTTETPTLPVENLPPATDTEDSTISSTETMICDTDTDQTLLDAPMPQPNGKEVLTDKKENLSEPDASDTLAYQNRTTAIQDGEQKDFAVYHQKIRSIETPSNTASEGPVPYSNDISRQVVNTLKTDTVSHPLIIQKPTRKVVRIKKTQSTETEPVSSNKKTDIPVSKQHDNPSPIKPVRPLPQQQINKKTKKAAVTKPQLPVVKPTVDPRVDSLKNISMPSHILKPVSPKNKILLPQTGAHSFLKWYSLLAFLAGCFFIWLSRKISK